MSIAIPGLNAQAISHDDTMTRDNEGHFVQFYSDDDFLFDVLARYVGVALATGDAAVVIGTEAHQLGLEQRLAARCIDTTAAVKQGRFVRLEARETLAKFLVNGKVDEELFTRFVGRVLRQARGASLNMNKSSRVAVFGEMVALLWAEGKSDEAIRVEQFWNRLVEKHPFTLLCAYPITGFDNQRHMQPFFEICLQHSSVVPSESYLRLESEDERLRRIAYLQQPSHT